GLMHIAAAFNKSIISYWGNTVPEFGMTPYLPAPSLNNNKSPYIILNEVKDLACRPCSKIGFDRCPKGHFKCMTNL
ncbi:MAG: glycosyl transferase, partial [Bacteroidetes bacterium]|nr:glycosyl transferase [Bacteroidota bacterium]